MRPTTYGYLVGAAFRRPWDGRPVPYFVFIHYSLFSILYSLFTIL